jgi:MFS family permease
VTKKAAPRPRLVTSAFLLIAFSTFAYFVSVGALTPALPRYVEGPLGSGEVAVGVTVGMFSVAALLLRPLSGRLSDRRGRRVVIVFGALLVTLSVAGYVVASSLAVLLALRLVTGAGEAFFYTGAASAINDLAPEDRRGEALSLFSLALYAGLAVGPVIGEGVLDAASFDAAWAVAGVSALAAGVLGALTPETRPDNGESEVRFRLLHPAGLLPGTVLAAGIWGLSGFMTFMPLYALELGLSGSRFVFVVYSSIVLSIRSLGARIPDRLGARTSARLALSATAAGMALIGTWRSPAGLFTGAAVFAVGQALAFPALMTIAVRGATVAERGAVVGTFTAFFDLAFGLGAVTLGGVAAALGYQGTFLAAALVAVGGLAVLLRAPPPGRPPTEESRELEEIPMGGLDTGTSRPGKWPFAPSEGPTSLVWGIGSVAQRKQENAQRRQTDWVAARWGAESDLSPKSIENL